MIAPGLLDRRLRIYERQEGGADGFARPVWVFLTERWGRLDVLTNAANNPMTPQAHTEQRLTAAVTFDDSVEVPALAVIRDANDPAYIWTVQGRVALRQLRALRVTVQAVDPMDVATFEFSEGVDTLDGMHLIETRGG